MSFGFFGIQFGFALQNANVSRIFQTLGAEIDKIGIFMDGRSTNRVIGAANNWLSQRSNLASEMGKEKAFLFYRGGVRFVGTFFNATVNHALDGSHLIVDIGCIYQYFHGAIQGICWR